MPSKTYISKSTLIILIISALIILGTSGCKNATDNSGSVSDSQLNAPVADSASDAPNQAEDVNCVYDDKWRDKVTETDTEQCLKDIISSGFDFQTIYNTPEKEKDSLAFKYLVDGTSIVKEYPQDILVSDIIFSERELYKLSKCKYRCDITKISVYEIKEFSGFDKRFMIVFKNFIKSYLKDAFDHLDADETKFILDTAYYVMIAKAYQKFIKESGYDMTFVVPIEAALVPTSIPTPSPAPSPEDALDAQAKSIASQITQNVTNEIRMEEGKSVGQFFSIKNALKPCKKKPASCEEKIAPLVDESFVKYRRGIAATILLLNNNKFDEQLFNKVNAELKRNYDSFGKMRSIADNSPVGREIMNANFIDDDVKEQIFYIWYLRQYPYAGEDIWKNQYKPSYDWKEYLNMADNYID